MERKSKFGSEKLTMLVNSCDAYQDVWPLFFSALDQHWGDRPFDVVLNCESTLDKLGINNSGSLPWGGRLLKLLNFLNSEYVILVFDDFLLEAPVDVEKIGSIVTFLDQRPDASVYYLNAVCLNTHQDDEYSEFRVLRDLVDYRLNSAPAIWRRKDLIAYTSALDTPWVWEFFGSYRTFLNKKEFYSPSSVKNNIFKYSYQTGGAIYRGKWVRNVVVPLCDKYDLNVDFSIRGFADLSAPEKRSLIWKVGFFLTGCRAVGVRTIFYFRCIRNLFSKFE